MTPAALAETLKPFLHYRRWCIAYSGGVDSHVLLHALVKLRETLALPPLVAIHINHQLNPRALDWAAHCHTVCTALGVELIVETVAVRRAAGSGLEAAARMARYAAFEKNIGAEELLLQAHHRDDQVETLLLRLLRGSGSAGLAAIPMQRALGAGRLLRPLLHYTRAEIIDYAQQHHLQWIHDDSNDNAAFDRNFLRLRVLPLLTERWPAYRNTLQRVIDNAAETKVLLQELAALDFGSVIATAASPQQGALNIASCLRLSAARQRNLIFYWLQQQRLPLPSREQLVQVLAMFAAREDAEPCVTWPGAELRRFRGFLYALKPLSPVVDFDSVWNPSTPLTIDGIGVLQAHAVIGHGLRADRAYRVRNRRGGERCQPLGRAHSQTLKKLLQEHDIPPWWRDRMPLIYCGEQIAAVANIWVCEGFQAAPDENGWRLEWQCAT